MSTIDQFRQKLLRGGHRSNRFRITVTFPSRVPSASQAQSSFEFLAYGGAMPSQAIESIPLKYRGRTCYFAGDPKEPEEFKVSVYNSTTFDIRNALIEWKNNYIQPDSITGEDLIDTADVFVDMLDKQDNIIQQGHLFYAWPTDIGSIALSWSTENTISTFDLTLKYDWVEEIPVK
jgi:hypothetical protein